MGKKKSPLKTLFKERVYFLFEVLIIFLGLFIFMLIPVYLVPVLIEPSSVLFEPVYYIVRAVSAIIAIIIFLYLSNFIMESQKRKVILNEDIVPAQNFINLFRISKKNVKYQFLYGILILFLIFIPLDFFTYLFLPDMISYSAIALDPSAEFSLNSYLLEDYFIFLISVIIVQVFVAVYEEALTRGFLTNRGSDYMNKMSAVIISSFFFGLGHYRYIFTRTTTGFPALYPFIWFIQTFLVGIVLSMIVLKKHWIFPVIFAHGFNNIISAHAIWNYLKANDFILMTLTVYIPLLVISVILLVWQFSRIKESITSGFKEFKLYFKNDENIGEETLEKFVRIMYDFLFGFIIFLVGVIII
ncbi:MAG: CPBP family intramembrane metalloprotease [Candidatus Lokiarchaeota archaeon]|nr:CPBP family intramembrane metalloprotease [Candidatus Lokiarchaeota archaeon]